MMMNVYEDRVDAGRQLGERPELAVCKGDREGTIILGLPRGGIPVAYQVAQALGNLPMDVLIVRKLGLPHQPEYAMGAIGMDGVQLLDPDTVQYMHVSQRAIHEVVEHERGELARRVQMYIGDRTYPTLKGKRVIVVDDGMATGSSMKAGIQWLKSKEPAQIIVAVPVSSREAYLAIKEMVDDIICPLLPKSFQAVGLWYNYFPQTTDQEVIDLLKRQSSYIEGGK